MTTKKELLTRIRLNCQECLGGPRACERQMGHKAEDIEGCTSPECAFFEFRFGTDPVPNQAKAEAARKRIMERIGDQTPRDENRRSDETHTEV